VQASSWSDVLAVNLVGLLMWALPLLLWPGTKEAFRLPKLLIGELIALLSLLPLLAKLWVFPSVRWRDLAAVPVVKALVPLLLVATVGGLFTAHFYHFRDAITDLWIGVACLVGWSTGIDRERLEAVLRLLVWPATLLAALVIDQHHHILGLLDPLHIQGAGRYALTATAGNPGDLAAYLVLPMLVAQWRLRRESGSRRWLLAAALLACGYALALTQTLAAILAVVVASGVLWMLPMTWPRRFAFLAVALALGAIGVAATLELAGRVAEKAGQIGQGEVNAAMTGRLDGWIAATRMFAEHPWIGVGHGAFRPEFIPAKQALIDEGVAFYPEQPHAVFANVHNEFLEAAAEWGAIGLASLAWALGQLLAVLRRLPGDRARRRDLAWAGVCGLAILSTFWFPWRVAIVAFPALLLLSWIFAGGRSEP